MTMLMGMLKPIPSLPPELLAMAVLMPTTSPRKLINGPPLLPGLIAASVCRKSWNLTFSVPSSKSRRLFGADDAIRYGMAQPKGAADGQDKVADIELPAISNAGGNQPGRSWPSPPRRFARRSRHSWE